MDSDCEHQTVRITGTGKLYGTNRAASSDPFDAWIDTITSPAADATNDNVLHIIAGTNDLLLFNQGVTEIAVIAVGLPALTSAQAGRTRSFDTTARSSSAVSPAVPKAFSVSESWRRLPDFRPVACSSTCS